MRNFFIIILGITVGCFFAQPILASSKGSLKGSDARGMKGSAHYGSAKGSMQGEHNYPQMEHRVTGYAKAEVRGTQDGSTLSGTVVFMEIEDGLVVTASLSNVSPAGKHGFHIHHYGSCANGGKAAGGHYNPDKTSHGLLTKDGPVNAHPGDMGNIVADEGGNAQYSGFLPGVYLSGGKYNVSGRAVIIHAKEDDFGQPTGNAGARIGCGTIALTKE